MASTENYGRELKDATRIMAALDPETREHACSIRNTLHEAGFECYLVGGAVRDLLLGQGATDLDFATNARPEKVQRLFKRTVPTGIKHGTISILFNDARYEVTTYRGETRYTDGRHPDAVRFADTLDDDLSRRDFTINALALEPVTAALVDLHNGLDDLRRGVIRTIGAPRDRFFEDGLRPVRACRLAATLDFDLAPETEAALADREVHGRSRLIAIERFTDELWKGFKATHVASMIRHLEKSELMYRFFPSRFGLIPATTAACFVDLAEMEGRHLHLKMARWWDDLGLNTSRVVAGIGQALKFSNRQIHDIDWFCQYFAFQRAMADEIRAATGVGEFVPVQADEEFLAEPTTRYRMRGFLSGLKGAYRKDTPWFLEAVENLPGNTIPPAELQAVYESDPLTIRDLAINGNDLMILGLSGPMIGDVLRHALDFVLRSPARNNRADLMAHFKRSTVAGESPSP